MVTALEESTSSPPALPWGGPKGSGDRPLPGRRWGLWKTDWREGSGQPSPGTVRGA